jgi:hypothetical protein
MISPNDPAGATSPIVRAISQCMLKECNVLLIGAHGVGKTQMVLEEAQRQGLRLKYYSASTLDPWADLVGIPVPVDVDGHDGRPARKELLFIRPADVDAAEIVFFDELNRSHPKVQNAVLEMVQFKSINGSRLPKLRMVWAAINPPDEAYGVSDLDPVLQDRFHVHLPVPARPSVAYYRDQAHLPDHVARALVQWWQNDLNDDLRKLVSPRRLEYMGRNYVDDIPLRHSLPFGVRVPWQLLLRRLESSGLLRFELTRESLVEHQAELLAEMAENMDVMVAVGEALRRWPGVVPQCVALFLAMPSEIQASLMTDPKIKKPLVNLAREGRRGGKLRSLADRLTAMGILR